MSNRRAVLWSDTGFEPAALGKVDQILTGETRSTEIKTALLDSTFTRQTHTWSCCEFPLGTTVSDPC